MWVEGGVVACDGEWLVVVGCYLLLWVLLVVVPWQDCSVTLFTFYTSYTFTMPSARLHDDLAARLLV